MHLNVRSARESAHVHICEHWFPKIPCAHVRVWTKSKAAMWLDRLSYLLWAQRTGFPAGVVLVSAANWTVQDFHSPAALAPAAQIGLNQSNGKNEINGQHADSVMRWNRSVFSYCFLTLQLIIRPCDAPFVQKNAPVFIPPRVWWSSLC